MLTEDHSDSLLLIVLRIMLRTVLKSEDNIRGILWVDWWVSRGYPVGPRL